MGRRHACSDQARLRGKLREKAFQHRSAPICPAVPLAGDNAQATYLGLGELAARCSAENVSVQCHGAVVTIKARCDRGPSTVQFLACLYGNDSVQPIETWEVFVHW